MCSSVDLPEPDGPDDGGEFAVANFQRHRVEGADRRLAGVLLDDIDQLERQAGSSGRDPLRGAVHDGTTTSASASRSPSTCTKPLVNRPGGDTDELGLVGPVRLLAGHLPRPRSHPPSGQAVR